MSMTPAEKLAVSQVLESNRQLKLACDIFEQNSADAVKLDQALRWALRYVKLPDGEDQKAWTTEYNEAKALVP